MIGAMKNRCLIALLAAITLLMTAQNRERFVRTYAHTDTPQAAVDNIRRDMAQRGARRQLLPPGRQLLDGNQRIWTNGISLFATIYDNDQREVIVDSWTTVSSGKWDDPIGRMRVKSGRVLSEARPQSAYTVERLGAYVMLVERNRQGKPLSAYYRLEQKEVDNSSWAMLLQFLLAGNYATPDGKNVVFGPKMPFYSGSRYDTDPGMLEGFCINSNPVSVDILYGEGRVSHGNPNHPSYGKQMPGAGGAGAIMPAMQWNLRMTAQGMHVRVVEDQKYVDHNPRIDDNTTLQLLQSPYEGLDGKWAFASVIPLTHQLLRIFPPQVLTLVRAEIYARHGDTFADSNTQAYFDAQPWYKRSNKPVVLTDIERFNYALIKHVEQQMQ